MRKIDLSEYKFEVNGKQIDHANINSLLFKNFMDIVDSIINIEDNADFEKKITRLRIIKQITLITTDGQELKLDTKTILQLPFKLGLILQEAISENDTLPGKVLNDADGLEAPLLYQLGTPIKMSNGEVRELEFQAKTYGDIEDIVSETSMLKRAYKMITLLSTPISNDVKLLRTTESMADQIQLADGLMIGQVVSKRFLELDAN